MVTRGVEHGVALIERHGTQILKGLLDARLAIGRERHHAAAGLTHLHLLLGRHAFQHLAASQTAIALLFRHLVQLVQLLDKALLGRRSQAVEAGIAAQQLFLLIDSKSAVLIQPVAEMSRRSRARIGISINVSGTSGLRLHAIRAAIWPVPGTLAGVILRILLIGPLLVLILRLVLVRSLLVLILRLLILIRPLLVLIGLVLIRPLLILILPLLIGVGARRILDLAGRALLPGRMRLILTEPCAHGGTGIELSSMLTEEARRGHTEEQDRSGS